MIVASLLLGTAAAALTLGVGVATRDTTVTTVSVVVQIAVMLWIFWRDRTSSMPVFFFTLCFGLFLVGRQLASLVVDEARQYGALETGAATAEQLNEAHLLLFLSLAGLALGWFIARTRPKNPKAASNHRSYDVVVRKTSATILIFATPAKIYAIWLASQTIRSAGFFDGRLASTSVPLSVRTFEELFTFAVLAYLAARPRLRPALYVCALYVAVGALTLQTFSRSEFILNLIIVILYLYHRQAALGEKIFTVGRSAGLLATTPLILTAMNWLASQRGRGTLASEGVLASLVDFVYAQGVSIKVLVFSGELQSSGSPKFFTVGSLTETILNFRALLTGSDQFSGQSAARATEGYQLSHTISYAIAPVDYLNGVGYGSSFVAELWLDLGLSGVIVGSALYGVLLTRSQALLGREFLTSFITLLLLRGMMFTPRASFVYPISELLSPASILALAGLAMGVSLAHLGRRSTAASSNQPTKS